MNKLQGAILGVGLLGIVVVAGYNSINHVILIEKN